MPNSSRGSSKISLGGGLNQNVLDIIAIVFKLSLFVTLALFGYLLWGIFSGSLADAANAHAHTGVSAKQVVETVSGLVFYTNLSLIVTLVSCCILYYEDEKIGVILILIAAFMAFGLNFVLDFFFASDTAKLTSGPASKLALQSLHQAALFIGIPGAALVLRHLFGQIIERRQQRDFANLTYGKGVKREQRKRPLIPAFSACWDLPFCRDGIRIRCPIFHAKTRCWRERVGCMCEENIILLAMEGAPAKPTSQDMTAEKGFVPIGDLLTKTDTQTRAKIPMRVGPRGVKIPTNPNITDANKRERCRNCIIYNEHQRLKYNLLSPIVTLAVPILAYLNLENLRGILGALLTSIDQLAGHLTFSGQHTALTQKLEQDVSGSFTVEMIILVCMTLVVMSLTISFLEYCLFKIKI